MAYLYRHIRLDKNVPFYIGVGNDTRNYRRAYDSVLRTKLWKNIAAKGYEVEILLDGIEYEDVLKKEQEFVLLYGRIDLKTGTLANLTDGGDGVRGYRHSEETKRKRSIRLTGANHPLFGKNISAETRLKIKNANTGKKRSQDVINKIILFHTGKKRSPEACQRIKEATKVRPVLKYDLNGNFIKEYKSISEAAIDNNTIVSNISLCCQGGAKSAKKLIWRYKTSDDIPIKIEKREPGVNDKKAVLQYSLDGTFIKEFETIRLACKETGSRDTSIIMCCKGKLNTHNNYTWRYKKGDIKINIETPNKNPYTPKSVIQYTITGIFVAEYETIAEAARAVNGDPSYISLCCRGRAKTANKFIWKFKDI